MMGKIVSGRTLLLNLVLDIPEYEEVYLVQATPEHNWQEMCKIDLGRKRILHVERECYLVFVSKEGISINKIDFPEKTDFSEDPDGINHPVINIVVYLKRVGVACKTISYPLKSINEHMRNGIFSQNGYYLQDSSWCDCWTFACDLYLAEKQLVIEGKSVNYFSVSHARWVETDIGEKMKDDIINVLSAPVSITENEFDNLLNKRGVKDVYQYFEVKFYE